MVVASKISLFRQRLMEWHGQANARTMPWKGERDPYRIWLSEIILQQTRTEQGKPYYLRFLEAYPTVRHLAAAPQEEVFKLWEGLGYYSRCKNLIATAKMVAASANAAFPRAYSELLTLKGVGPYTAAAIASFAFDLPHAVLDGNVFRCLARFFGIDLAIDSASGKKYFSELAGLALDPQSPAGYNQAVMDFGATVCKPKNPACEICPLHPECIARQKDLIAVLPVKEKKLIRKTRFFNYIVAQHEGKLYLRERLGADIWQHLHEFILIETPEEISAHELMHSPAVNEMLPGLTVGAVSKLFKQQLTHQTINARFINVRLSAPVSLNHGYRLYTPAELSKLAFPRVIATFLSEMENL